MLVLSRKKNESIVINNDITVTVVEIRGDKVRLGIVRPRKSRCIARKSMTPSTTATRTLHPPLLTPSSPINPPILEKRLDGFTV